MPQLDAATGDLVSPVGRATWFQKVFPTDITGGSTIILAPVRAATEPVNMLTAGRNVSAEFMFYGKGADNATILTTNIYAVTLLGGPPALGDRRPALYEPQLLLTISTMLLSAQLGIAGGFIDNTYRFVDTIPAPTKSAYCTYLEALTGRSVQVYSPGGDLGIARICIPDIGMTHGFVVDIEGGTATPINCLAAFWT